MALLPQAPWPGPWASRWVLLVAWAIANESALRWMFLSLAQPAHLVQRAVLMGLAAWGLWECSTRAPAPRVHAHALPLVLSSVAFAAIARLGTDVRFVQAAAALMMLGALSACFVDARTGRQRLVWLAVLLLCLPVQTHVDAHVGLPLRLWTAQAVAPLLQALGVPNVSMESIIVTENGVADVASACSGVRTLWYAAALWLCARLAWPHAPLWRWLLAGVLAAAAAVGFNALRVAALVLALHHQASPLLADMAHASLGLLALALVAAIQLLLCRGQSSRLLPPVASSPAPSWRRQMLLAACVASVALLPAPTRRAPEPAPLQALAWPAEFRTQQVPLSPLERDLVLGRHATVAEKHRFDRLGVRGSLLVVQSGDWRAHHAPELCLLAQGARVEKLVRLGTPQGEFRAMTMQSGTQTALTWFQSGARVVPDLGARLWSQLLRPGEHWSLVTLVVDTPLTASATLDLHGAVQRVVVAHPPGNKP